MHRQVPGRCYAGTPPINKVYISAVQHDKNWSGAGQPPAYWQYLSERLTVHISEGSGGGNPEPNPNPHQRANRHLWRVSRSTKEL